MQETSASGVQPDRSMRAGALIGAGLIAAGDEIVFHQLLGWHHFYDRATPAIALLSDGLLHAVELAAIVAGFFLFPELRRQRTLAPYSTWAGFFLGAGAFQLFDGLINHKVLRLHQIRYGVETLPYDLAWNLAGLALLLVAAGTHASLTKMMYGYGWPRGLDRSPEELRAAAQWMYYGGDLAEVLLIIVFFAIWFRRRRPGHLPLPH